MGESTLRQKAIYKYIRKAKHVYHGKGPVRKQFISDLSDALTCYSETHPDCSYEDLVEEFGSPDEIRASFLSLYSSDLKKRNIRLYRIVFICCLIAALLALAFTVSYVINSYQHSKGYYIEYIEDDEPFTPASDEPAPVQQYTFD